jgi:hypothetical protein
MVVNKNVFLFQATVKYCSKGKRLYFMTIDLKSKGKTSFCSDTCLLTLSLFFFLREGVMYVHMYLNIFYMAWHTSNIWFWVKGKIWHWNLWKGPLFTPKLCNQVLSLSLSRWRTLILEKIKICWVLWCIKLQTIVSCWEEYCKSIHSWLFGCRTTKIATSNDWNGITSKKPGTILSMQNVELGQTKVMQIRKRETLNHQGAITHEVCCLAAQLSEVWSTQPIYIFNRENPQISESPNDPWRGLDFIALVYTDLAQTEFFRAFLVFSLQIAYQSTV